MSSWYSSRFGNGDGDCGVSGIENGDSERGSNSVIKSSDGGDGDCGR